MCCYTAVYSWSLTSMVHSHLTLLIQYQSLDRRLNLKAGQWTSLLVSRVSVIVDDTL